MRDNFYNRHKNSRAIKQSTDNYQKFEKELEALDKTRSVKNVIMKRALGRAADTKKE